MVDVGSQSAQDRASAYVELGRRLRLGGGEEVFRQLRVGLEDPDRRARRAATRSLLHAIVPNSESGETANAVASLIAAIDRDIVVDLADAANPLDAFVEASNLSVEEQTLCVLLLLEGMDPEGIAPYAEFVLDQVSDSPSSRVRAQALRTVRSTMPSWPELPMVVQGFLDHGSADEKVAALQTVLANQLVALSENARQRLGDPDESVRVFATHTVAGLGMTAAAPDLVGLSEDPVRRVRIHAASALSELGFPEWNEVLISIASGVTEGSEMVSAKDRGTALSELSRVAPEAAAILAIPILWESLPAGSGLGSEENPTFSAVATGSDSRKVLTAAIRAAVPSIHPSAGVILTAYMDDDDPILVVETAVALHRRGDGAGTAQLMDWVTGSDVPVLVRALAIAAAERLGDAVFKPALEQAEQGDAAPANREAASEALDEIGTGN